MMTPNEMLSKAISLTAQKFEGKLDKGGQPYILHCLWVMNGVDQDDPELMAAAVMHDLVEDTDITLHDLTAMGFSPRVCRVVGVCTHREGVPYMDYVKGCALDIDARPIKKKDLEHNTQVTRLKGLGKKDFDRMEKYCTAYEYLKRV
jgi:hypothetical protein